MPAIEKKEFKSIEGYTEKYLNIKKKPCRHIEVFL